MHALLVSYTETSKQALRSCPLLLSLGTDKSVVKSYSLQSTVAVLPTNEAFWLIPQVFSGIPWRELSRAARFGRGFLAHRHRGADVVEFQVCEYGLGMAMPTTSYTSSLSVGAGGGYGRWRIGRRAPMGRRAYAAGVGSRALPPPPPLPPSRLSLDNPTECLEQGRHALNKHKTGV